MSAPIVFISHFKVKEGKLDALRQFAQSMTEHLMSEKPSTVAFLQYLNEEGTEQSVVHVFSNADAFDQHSAGVTERTRAAFEFIVSTRRDVYGMPSEKARAMRTLKPPDAPEITLHHMLQHKGGYIRFKSG